MDNNFKPSTLLGAPIFLFGALPRFLPPLFHFAYKLLNSNQGEKYFFAALIVNNYCNDKNCDSNHLVKIKNARRYAEL